MSGLFIMPTRPAKACRVSNCPNPVTDRKYQGYCEQHKDKAGWFANEKAKGNRHQRGYGKDWQAIRLQALKRDAYLCQSCKAKGKYIKATTVDHVKAKEHGGTNALHNLQSLCESCHTAKTARERVRGGVGQKSEG